MFGLSFSEILVLLLGVATLIKYLFEINSAVKDPNIVQDSKIQKIEDRCVYKHQGVDKDISAINEQLTLIKENHLSHIESDVRMLFVGQERIETILNERLPKK